MIFVDTNVVAETLKKDPRRGSHCLADPIRCPTRASNVTIAEIAFGIQKIRPDQRAERLEQGLADWRRRFADRIFGLRWFMGKIWVLLLARDAACRHPMA